MKSRFKNKPQLKKKVHSNKLYIIEANQAQMDYPTKIKKKRGTKREEMRKIYQEYIILLSTLRFYTHYLFIFIFFYNRV